jgi:hypothetical protein
MDPAARAHALTSYAEPRRNYLQDRLREYESLPADEREMRLKQLELNCHLPDLMKIAPANRAKRLAAVPADIRPLVEKKLQEWDLLPPDVQRDVLEHQTTATYFLRVRPGSAAQPQPVSMSTLPPLPGAEGASSDPEKLERFFKLPAREQEKTLDVLPAREREDMERTLQAFAKLPLTQRQTCIDSFVKFRRLSKEQRDQFLKNAERWKAMSPAERETWRTLVKILPPGAVSTNMPPLPHPQDGFGPGTTASNAGSSLPGQ